MKRAEFSPRVTGQGKRWVSTICVLLNVQKSQSLSQHKWVCSSESQASGCSVNINWRGWWSGGSGLHYILLGTAPLSCTERLLCLLPQSLPKWPVLLMRKVSVWDPACLPPLLLPNPLCLLPPGADGNKTGKSRNNNCCNLTFCAVLSHGTLQVPSLSWRNKSWRIRWGL